MINEQHQSNDLADQTTKEPVATTGKLVGRHIVTMVLLHSAQFLAGMGFSMIVPFFPNEARRKGMSDIEIGLLSSVYQIVQFIMCPVYGNFLTRIGPKTVYVGGIIVGGVATMAFGVLNSCPAEVFQVLCFMCRALEGLGIAASYTAGLAIVSNMFPNHVSTVYGTLQNANGFGIIAGPGVGGALYTVGGFGLSLYSVGSLIILNGLVMCTCLPPQPEKAIIAYRPPMLSILRSPLAVVSLINIVTSSIGLVFINLTFFGHLEKEFDIGVLAAGFIFMIGPCLNTAISPFWGYLVDSRNIQSPLIIIGNLLCVIAFLLIGPCDYLPFLPVNIGVVTCGIVLYGLFIGCILLPSMKCLLIGATEIGFDPHNLDTLGIVFGLCKSAYCLGAAIGGMLAGVLIEEWGSFRKSVVVVSSCFLFAMVAAVVFFSVRRLLIRGSAEILSKDGYIYKRIGEEDKEWSDHEPAQTTEGL